MGLCAWPVQTTCSGEKVPFRPAQASASAVYLGGPGASSTDTLSQRTALQPVALPLRRAAPRPPAWVREKEPAVRSASRYFRGNNQLETRLAALALLFRQPGSGTSRLGSAPAAGSRPRTGRGGSRCRAAAGRRASERGPGRRLARKPEVVVCWCFRPEAPAGSQAAARETRAPPRAQPQPAASEAA